MAVIRRLFAGGQIRVPVFLLFPEIIGPKTKRVYLLKGGPGGPVSPVLCWILPRLYRRGGVTNRNGFIAVPIPIRWMRLFFLNRGGGNNRCHRAPPCFGGGVARLPR